MADNTTLNAGTGGDVIATDDVAGVKYQQVKLVDGTADSTTVIASGGGVEAGALRVTVASDSTGVLSVDDNGASLTVDNAALSVTGGGVEASAMRVTLASDSTGVLSVDDNGGSLTIDNATLTSLSAAINASKVDVNVASGGISGFANDAALTIGTSEGVPVMARASAAAPSNVSADNDAVHIWALQSGAVATQPTYAGVLASAGNGASGTGVQRVTIANDSTGVLATVTNVATIGTSVTPGTSAAHLGKAEDAAAGSGDTGVAVFAVRRDSPSSDVSAAGDYATLQVNSTGSLWTTDVANAAGGYSLNSLIAPATPAKNVITSAASTLYTITAFNLLATPVYLKVWDNATGSVTLGTTACNYQFMIPGNTAGTGFVINLGKGVAFANGIITAVTSAISTTDNTATTANSIIVNIGYK